MRFSKAFIPTLKEVTADEQEASHVFMIRGGYIRKVAAGIYNFLPLGWRVIQRIETIVREEMDRAGAHEVLIPDPFATLHRGTSPSPDLSRSTASSAA